MILLREYGKFCLPVLKENSHRALVLLLSWSNTIAPNTTQSISILQTIKGMIFVQPFNHELFESICLIPALNHPSISISFLQNDRSNLIFILLSYLQKALKVNTTSFIWWWCGHLPPVVDRRYYLQAFFWYSPLN